MCGRIAETTDPMAEFQVNTISAPPPVSHVQQIQSPKPPKVQSDHKPANPVTSSRGPAVVLSGALAKSVEKNGQQARAEPPPPTGQHINHVI
ncbi:MAG TPA: hypothetical protein VHN39_05530 [Phenylobacterium sp.]|jgi:hypothetical protein|nr:hypothetical protein [Phenylobacterium sp.]